MKFSDFIADKAIKVGLESASKPEVISELVDLLVASGGVEASERDAIVEAILKREELGSTGIGRGVAIPHTKHPAMKHFAGAVGISDEGIDFASLDGGKVHVLFLLVSPTDDENHVRALQRIAVQLRDETFCRFLRQAQTTADVRHSLDDADEEN